MYEKFYGFKENPFAMTPDPKFFFPSQKHTEALDSLIYTIAEKRGFAVVTGEIGSGKTTICRTLLNRLDSGTKVAMITNTYLSPKELLSYILEELGVTFDGGEKSNLLSCLKKFLVEQLYLDFNVVLIIDEAQNLNLKMLEEIRMLSNLETEKEKMLQIILTGQPVLKDKLESKELVQLRQRINVQYHIPPLNRIDSERYINHRLDVASINGNRQVEFTTEAIDEIYTYSQGIPRMVNRICNNALLIGYVIEAKQITPQIIKEATEEFQNETKIDKAIVSLPQERLRKITKETKAKQSQLQEAESSLKQLNEQLHQLQKEKEEAQLQQDELNQEWLERQKEWQAKEKEASQQLQSIHNALINCESSLQQKTLELKDLIKKIDLSKEEMRYKEERLKFAPLNKVTESKTPEQPESKQIVDLSNKNPIIKLKAGQLGANTAVLTASASGSEIKIDSIDNDDSLSSVYSGIRIFHPNRDLGTYKNFIFFAKGERKRDYLTVFRIELGNGAMKARRHYSVRLTDSWQKFNITLEDFSRIINLNIITEIALFPDATIEADDITYIKDIYFSNG